MTLPTPRRSTRNATRPAVDYAKSDTSGTNSPEPISASPQPAAPTSAPGADAAPPATSGSGRPKRNVGRPKKYSASVVEVPGQATAGARAQPPAEVGGGKSKKSEAVGKGADKAPAKETAKAVFGEVGAPGLNSKGNGKGGNKRASQRDEGPGQDEVEAAKKKGERDIARGNSTAAEDVVIVHGVGTGAGGNAAAAAAKEEESDSNPEATASAGSSSEISSVPSSSAIIPSANDATAVSTSAKRKATQPPPTSKKRKRTSTVTNEVHQQQQQTVSASSTPSSASKATMPGDAAQKARRNGVPSESGATPPPQKNGSKSVTSSPAEWDMPKMHLPKKYRASVDTPQSSRSSASSSSSESPESTPPPTEAEDTQSQKQDRSLQNQATDSDTTNSNDSSIRPPTVINTAAAAAIIHPTFTPISTPTPLPSFLLSDPPTKTATAAFVQRAFQYYDRYLPKQGDTKWFPIPQNPRIHETFVATPGFAMRAKAVVEAVKASGYDVPVEEETGTENGDNSHNDDKKMRIEAVPVENKKEEKEKEKEDGEKKEEEGEEKPSEPGKEGETTVNGEDASESKWLGAEVDIWGVPEVDDSNKVDREVRRVLEVAARDVCHMVLWRGLKTEKDAVKMLGLSP